MSETSLYLIKKAREIYSQSELAEILEVSERTIRRWEVNETEPPPYLTHAIRQMILPLSFNDNRPSDFKFIDLFAGIGGIRKGFEELGGHCVFTSEWNDFSKKTYLANFSSTPSHIFAGDITKIDESDAPEII